MNIILIPLFLLIITYLAMVYTTYLLFKRQGLSSVSKSLYYIFPVYSLIAHFNISIRALLKRDIKSAIKIIWYSIYKFDISVTLFTTMIMENIAQYEAYGSSKMIYSKSIEQIEKKETKSEFIKRIFKEFSKPLALGRNIREIYSL